MLAKVMTQRAFNEDIKFEVLKMHFRLMNVSVYLLKVMTHTALSYFIFNKIMSINFGNKKKCLKFVEIYFVNTSFNCIRNAYIYILQYVQMKFIIMKKGKNKTIN